MNVRTFRSGVLFLLVLPLFIAALLPVTAQGAETISVTLHKRQFDQPISSIKNTGQLDENFPGQPLGGVEFSAYDVTEYYYQLLENGTAPEEAVKELQKNEGDQYSKKLVGTQVTGDGNSRAALGDAVFSLVEKIDGQDAVYLFQETLAEGVEAVGNSVNLVLVLPVYKGIREGDEVKFTDEINREVHLYPKNLILPRSVDLKKVGTSSNQQWLDGSEFILSNQEGKYFGGQYKEPGGIAVFDKEESAAKKIQVAGGSISLTGLLDGDYTLREVVAATAHELTVESQKVEFTVTSGQLQKVVIVEDGSKWGVPKDAIDYTQNELENTIIVENRAVGGFAFEKLDSNTKNKIIGAEFKLAKDRNTNYLYKKKTVGTGEYPYIWQDEITTGKEGEFEEVLLTSTDGSFSLSGLKLGTYFIHETKTPTGYAQPKGDLAYTEVKVTGAGNVTAIGEGILNVKKGFLPSTGGIGIVVFLAGGLTLIALSWLTLKKGQGNNK